MKLPLIFSFALLLFLSWCTTSTLDVAQKVIINTGRFVDDVIVVAHVGAPYEATYNSLEWFALAKKYWADAVEFDVSLTKDNHNIVIHGPSMEMNSTCLHPMKNVADYSLEELKADCKLNNGEPIRTLEEVLLEIKDWFNYYFIELKVYDQNKIAIQSTDVANTIKKMSLENRIIVTSYDHGALKKVVEQWILWWRDTYTPSEFTRLNNSAYEYFLADFRVLDNAIIDYVARIDRRLVAYTASDVAQFKQIYDMGIRIIMTDDIKNTMRYVLSGSN